MFCQNKYFRDDTAFIHSIIYIVKRKHTETYYVGFCPGIAMTNYDTCAITYSSFLASMSVEGDAGLCLKFGAKNNIFKCGSLFNIMSRT